MPKFGDLPDGAARDAPRRLHRTVIETKPRGATLRSMIDWWTETDHAIVECLRARGPMSPEELSRRIGLSVGEITAFLSMLVREERVRIRIVALTPEEENRLNRQQSTVSTS